MSSLRIALATTLVAAAAARGTAAPVMDGTADALYGAALSIQNTNTQFGDNNAGDLIATANGGSEIDQVFGMIADGKLYVTIAGNLERNFNKLEVFFDVDGAARGVNTINGDNLPTMVDGYCCTQGGGVNLPDPTQGALQRLNGLSFDAGFHADYYFTFTHGSEQTGPPGTANRVSFWALTAHYADLTQGANGPGGALGMQLNALGQPNVLRGPLAPDFNSNMQVGGEDFLTWQRNNGKFDGVLTFAGKPDGDANEDALVTPADLAAWEDRFGEKPSFADFPFVPYSGGPSTTSLVGPVLPGLSQGQLIDKNYANIGLARELAFALPPAASDPNNALNQRNLQNTIGLTMALNNSNTAGVSGAGPYETPTTGDPQNVRTGVEFAIPLAAFGNISGNIRMTAFINGTGHDFSSNQFSGDGVLTGNFGTLFPLLETEAPGPQFVTIPAATSTAATSNVPEPAAGLTAGLALAAAAAGRRRTRGTPAQRC